LKEDQKNKDKTFGVMGDYMTAVVDYLDGSAKHFNETRSPQVIPARDNPPSPWDDQEGQGMSLGEMLKEQLGDMGEEKGNKK